MARKKLQLQAYYSEDRVGLELLEVSLWRIGPLWSLNWCPRQIIKRAGRG